MRLIRHIYAKYKIHKSGLFDKEWYLAQYPEVRRCGMSPLRHYMKLGWKEGKNPSEHFDTNRYLAMYPDIRMAKGNPLKHYVTAGKKEGRICPAVTKDPTSHIGQVPLDYRPLVSVIVASYNYADLIGETLDSLLAQTYDNYEVIVVDDGSTDRSEEVIARYLENDKVHFYTHPGHANRGLCETIQLGLRHAAGEFIAFCESDDLWQPHYLERKVGIVNQYRDAAIISNNVELFGNEYAIRERLAYFEIINTLLAEGGNRIDYSRRRNLNYIATFSAVMIKKELLSGLDFHSPTPAWLDFWLYRQLLKNHLLYYTHEPLTRWRMHNSFNGLSNAKMHVRREGIFLALSDRLLGIAPPAYIRRRIRRIEKSAYWDEAYYTAHYGDRLEGLRPVEHYYYLGWKEGCNPSGNFSNDAYLNAYTDMQSGKINPLLHYERRGKKEGRNIFKVGEWKETPVTPADIETLASTTPASQRKVLFVSHELSLTGAPRALLNMVTVAQKAGIAPVILSLASGPMEAEIRRLGIRLYIRPSLHTQLLFGNKTLERFFAQFDLILFNTLATVSLLKDIPYNPAKKVCWLHEGSISHKHFGSFVNLPSILPLFDAVYTVGDYARSFTTPHLAQGQPVQDLLYGIPDERQKSLRTTADGKVRFLLAGSLCKRKGQRVLLKSLRYLPRKVRREMLVCLAGAPSEARVAKAVRHTRYACVQYLGELAHDKMLELYRDANVVLCPSLDDPMPIVCTEGMMFGKPVITSDHTGTASLVSKGNCGFVIPANDPKALARAIRKAVENKERLPRMGENARKVYEKHFTMDVFEKHLQRLFAG